MSYYLYMQSVYRSCLPDLNRSLRSSSVERSLPLESARFLRATTVGPTSAEYITAMPFTYQAERAVDRMVNRSSYYRASSQEPSTLYSRSYHTGTGYSAFDYKVMDYAARLDSEETTRRYINTRKDYYENHPTRSYSSYSSEPFRNRYDYYGAMKHERDFMYNTADVGSTYKHYRRSSATLTERNAREKSPLVSRELDRYYKTERRSSFVGDISSGPFCDFRHYNYRRVPYFGGSDYYTYVPRIIRIWNNDPLY